MSDSDSDEKSDSVRNGNYKSPSKRKRQKGEAGAVPKTYQFDISLSDTNGDDYVEVSYLDLVSKEEQRLKKLAQVQAHEKAMLSKSGALDPYASDDDDQLKALAASFEARYSEKPTTKKIGKVGGKKRKIKDYDDLGDGYDESDPFIDNSECFDEVVPQEITTAHGGFYINTGALEFKENKNAVYQLSSDDEGNTDSKKTKKVKKETVKTEKKHIKFKETKEKKKPKIKKTEVKNADVKRKARIINTNPNIKGPKGGNNSVKPEVKKIEAKKIDVKKVEVKKVEPAKIEKPAPAPIVQNPKSPEKSVPKPPEIIDLVAQLDALSKSVDMSKNDSKNYGFHKPSSPAQKVSGSNSSSKIETKSLKITPVSQSQGLPDLKLPASVRVTKVGDQGRSSKVGGDVINKTNLSPSPSSKSVVSISSLPSPSSNTKPSALISNKGGWQNQVTFSPARMDSGQGPKEVKQTAKDVKNSHNQNNLKTSSYDNLSISKDSLHKRPGSSVTSSSSKMSTARPVSDISSSSSPASVMSPMMSNSGSGSGSVSSSAASMFQHDPKNILASAVTTMSSILGTTAPYFAQKLQQSKSNVGTNLQNTKPIASHSQSSRIDNIPSPNNLNSGKTTPSTSSFSSQISSSSFVKGQSPSPLNLSSTVSNSSLSLSKHNSPSLPTKSNITSPSNSIYQNQITSRSKPAETKPPSSSNFMSRSEPQVGKTKLPTAPATSLETNSPQRAGVLSPEMTQSLLGIAENMMNDIKQSQTSVVQQTNIKSPTSQPQSSVKPSPQQQQQQSAYMSQFQNFANQQLHQTPQTLVQPQKPQQKSSGYEISNLLNSQPLPQAGSPSPSSGGHSSSRVIGQTVGRSPGNSQQQQQQSSGRSPVISQQQQQLTKQVNLSQHKPLNLQHSQQYQSVHVQSPSQVVQSVNRATAALPSSMSNSLTAQTIPNSLQQSPISRPQTQHHQQGQFNSQQLGGVQQQPLSRQQQEQQQQQALLQQFHQNYYLGGY